ncbi:MAG: nucleotidyltransferase domain-containing protein [Deltaproteobacteria bacterium]|nr:nucleotidyltransferase domain-containing protein [Deltaproteobacteria bacterium]
MDSQAELVARIRRSLSARSEVLDVYLFGSQARGDAQAHSDIDVAVYVAEEPESPFGYAADLTAELMSALSTNAVDLVVLNHAPPLLYHRVLRDGVRVYARDLKETTIREGQALSRHCDYVGQLAKIDAARRGRISGGELGP